MFGLAGREMDLIYFAILHHDIQSAFVVKTKFSELKVVELQQFLSQRGIKYSNKRKGEVLEFCRNTKFQPATTRPRLGV